MERLKEIYKDPSNAASFSTVDKLWPATKKEISKNEIRKFLQEQDSYTIYRQARKKFSMNPYNLTIPGKTYEVDLMSLMSYEKENDGNKYILTCIDIMSKKAAAISIINKEPKTVIEGLKHVFQQMGTPPKILASDKGGEFKNKKVTEFLKNRKIKQRFCNNPLTKCSIVERFNRTLGEKMYKYFHYYNTHRYVDVLDKLINSYNNTKHRTIKMTPNQVGIHNYHEVWKNANSRLIKMKKQKPKLVIGQNVRISRHKEFFEKGYAGSFSREIFKIKHIRTKLKIPVYIIEDMNGEEIDGFFYEKELIPVLIDENKEYEVEKIIKKRKRGKKIQVYVKWLNYPHSMNSWIDLNDLKNI